MQIYGKRGGEIGAEKEKRTGELEGEPSSSEQLSERKELSITAIKKA